jgi:hypothetical protein
MFGKCKPLTAAQRKARNLRLTASAAFYTAAVATTAANVYASQHSPTGFLVGLWPPAAFFLSLELIERIPLKGRQAYVRWGAVALLAVIAGWTSYWHLVHVVADAGTTDPVTLYGLPFTVDVLMAVARSVMVTRVPATPARPAARRKVQEEPAKPRRALKVA